jgi:hypothetical protein
MSSFAKEIQIQVENKPGSLARVTTALKDAGVNILALCGWGEQDKGMVMLLTDDNVSAIAALKKVGLAADEKEVVTTILPNRIGTVAEASQKLGRAEIDIQYCYFTANSDNALVVFSTKNNAKAKEILG